MRQFGAAWGSQNASSTKSRRFVFRIEWTGGIEDVFIVSHGDIVAEPGVTVLAARLDTVSVTSQTLFPDEGRTEIGAISFDALDTRRSISDNLRSNLLDHARGLRGKTIRMYVGFDRIAWTDYLLVQTQIVSDLSFQSGVYRVVCSDISREVRTEVFKPVVLMLAAPIDKDVTTIPLITSNGLIAVEHGASYSDGPGLTVAYVKIDDEIIRVAAGDIGLTELTNVQRGALSTLPVEHSTDENATVLGKGKAVTEIIYLEMPVPKLAYALLTGNLVDQSTVLPPHWCAGVLPDFVKLSEFTDIGTDWYDRSDELKGIIFRFVEPDQGSAKQFIEEQICRVLGAYMPIDASGQIGFRRMTRVLSDAPAVARLTTRHMLDRAKTRLRMDRTQNNIEILWNELDGELTRTNSIRDDVSIATHGITDVVRYEARGLHGTIHSGEIVRQMFDTLRDRYANPPIETTVDVQGSCAYLEVADIVRLVDPAVPDFTNAESDTLDRSFEIQNITYKWTDNSISLQLFGTSTPSGPLPPLDENTVIDDAWYSSEGTDLATLTGVTDNGTNLTLTGDVTFDGDVSLHSGTAILYATKDVIIPSGRTLFYANNTQLRVLGVINCSGLMSGKGNGLAGVSGAADVTLAHDTLPTHDALDGPVNFATLPGHLGYFGVTEADGGLIERVKQENAFSDRYAIIFQSLPATVTQGLVQVVPPFQLRWDGVAAVLNGLPDDLRGCSGGPGGLRFWHDELGNSYEINQGGTGGAGGAGLAIISRGFIFGASGQIDSSGADGGPPVNNLAFERPAWSGGGAGGAPGAILIVVDGALNPSPILTGHIRAFNGNTPRPAAGTFETPKQRFYEANQTRFFSVTTGNILGINRFTLDLSGLINVAETTGTQTPYQAGISASRVQILVPDVPIEADAPDVVLVENQVVTIAVTEAYMLRTDPTFTSVLVTSTEVATTDAYSHVEVYAKPGSPDGSKASFRKLGAAEPDRTFDLPADGSTWYFRAYIVLINGTESKSVYATASIAVHDSSLLPDPPDQIFLDPVALGFNVRVRVPNTGNGIPTGVKVYFGTGTNDTFPEVALADQVGVVYDSGAFYAQYLLAGLTAGDTVYVFATAFNANGESLEFPVSGSGVSDVVQAGPPGATGPTGPTGPPGVSAPAPGFHLWTSIDDGTTWVPTGTTQDTVFTFTVAGSAVSSITLRTTATLSSTPSVAVTTIATSGGSITVATVAGPSGGAWDKITTITDDASGATTTLTSQANSADVDPGAPGK